MPKDKQESYYKTIFFIFISFYSIFIPAFLFHCFTNVAELYKTFIIGHSWFFIGAFFIFLALLTVPIRLFFSKQLVLISQSLFLSKTKDFQNKHFYAILTLTFVLSLILFTMIISYYSIYSFIINFFIEDIKNGKVVACLYFSYLTILLWFSLELLQIETIFKILAQDILKIDYFKEKEIIINQNILMKKRTLTTFRNYCGEEIFLPSLLPLNYNDNEIGASIEKLKKLSNKILSSKDLSFDIDNIINENNLSEKSKLIYLIMQFRKSTRYIISDKEKQVIDIINNQEIYNALMQNIHSVNNYLVANNNSEINLHSMFDPLNKITEEIPQDYIFDNPVVNDNEEYAELINLHRKYLMEIVIRT